MSGGTRSTGGFTRKLRGTVSQDEWKAWLDETRDLRAEGVIVTFDDWKRLQQPEEALRLLEELYGPDEAKRISDRAAAEAASRCRPTPASTDLISALLALYQRQTEKESSARLSDEHTFQAVRR